MRWISAWPVLVCTTLMGCLISTSGLSGGPGPASDAGPDSSATVEAGVAINDASSRVEAGTDAGDASTSFCAGLAPRPAFCADFDESADVKTGWQYVVQGSGGGVQTVDGTTFTSSGDSLATKLPAGKATNDLGSTIGAALRKTIGTTADHVIVEFDLHFEAGDPNGYAQVATLFFGDSYQVHFMVNTGALLLQEDIMLVGGSMYPQTQVSSVLTANTWTHVTMNVQFGTTNTITITLDDQPSFVHPINAGASNGAFGLQIGAVYFYTGTVQATAIHQDNVVVRME